MILRSSYHFQFTFHTMDPSNASSDTKRVVLLIKTAKPDHEVVKAFLRRSNHSEDEYEHNSHYIHLDPDRQGAAKWSHIVVDMNAAAEQTVNLASLPHEIYKTKSGEDTL